MKNLLAVAVGAVTLWATGVSFAQNQTMMHGDMGGSGWMDGYGGIGVSVLLLIVVVALVATVLRQRGK